MNTEAESPQEKAERAAEAAAESAKRAREKADDFLDGAADKIGKARRFLHDPTSGLSLEDARNFARHYPGAAMFAAGLLGFFVARALYRRS